FDENDVSAFDGCAQIVGDLDGAARFGPSSVACNPEELDAELARNGARQIGREDEAALENAQQYDLPVSKLGANLAPHFQNSLANAFGADQLTNHGPISRVHGIYGHDPRKLPVPARGRISCRRLRRTRSDVFLMPAAGCERGKPDASLVVRPSSWT